MSDEPNKRDAAIRAYRERESRQAQVAAEQNRSREEMAQRQQQHLTTWTTVASNVISIGVLGCGDDFARRGSDFIIASQPTEHPGCLEFDVRRSGKRGAIAKLTFTLRDDGLVHAATTARGAKLPEAASVDTVTAKWADDAAEQVMFSVLGAHRIANDEPDFMRGGLQTYVPNQPRRGRAR